MLNLSTKRPETAYEEMEEAVVRVFASDWGIKYPTSGKGRRRGKKLGNSIFP
jgi:hypothetical protein